MGINAARWVLLPGTLCSRAVFAPLMQALGVAPALQVVQPLDRPDVADYRACLVDTVKSGDVVCGFSLGAIAAAHAADLLTEASAIVLIALNPRADTPEKRPARAGLRAAAHAGKLDAVFAAAARGLFAQPTAELLSQITNMARAEAHNIDAQTTLALTRPGAATALRACQVPVLFVTGTDDRQAPPELAQEAAQMTPKFTLRLVPGLGHFCLLEDPATVAWAIRDGLDALGVRAC